MVIYGPQVKSPSRLSEAILPIRIYYSLMPMDTSGTRILGHRQDRRGRLGRVPTAGTLPEVAAGALLLNVRRYSSGKRGFGAWGAQVPA